MNWRKIFPNRIFNLSDKELKKAAILVKYYHLKYGEQKENWGMYLLKDIANEIKTRREKKPEPARNADKQQ